MLEKTPESLLDSKEIKPVNPKGNQPGPFTGRIDAEAEAPMLWPPDAKGWLIGKDSDTGKDWGLEEKGTTLDEMVRWHHQLNGHESEQASGDSEGQGSLASHSPWDCIEPDMTEWLKNNRKDASWLKGMDKWKKEDGRLRHLYLPVCRKNNLLSPTSCYRRWKLNC